MSEKERQRGELTRFDGHHVHAPHRKSGFEDGGRACVDSAIVRPESHCTDLQSAQSGWNPSQVEPSPDEIQLSGS